MEVMVYTVASSVPLWALAGNFMTGMVYRVALGGPLQPLVGDCIAAMG